MFGRRAAPTHTWLVGNRIVRYFAALFVLALVVWLVIVFAVKGIVDHNCQDYYKRTFKFPGYWLHVDVGSTKQGCPQP